MVKMKNQSFFTQGEFKNMKETSDVLQQMKEMIYNNYKMGDRLPTEHEFSSMLNVGRSTIRENLKVLSEMGLIERCNKGTSVVTDIRGCLIEPFNMIVNLQRDNIRHLLELREILEVNIMVLAIERITPEGILQLERIQWLMQNPDFISETFRNNDIAFHNAIAQSTGNDILIELLSAIRCVIFCNFEQASMDPSVQSITLHDHQKIIDALRDKDSVKGLQYMQEHLKTSQKIYYQALDKHPDIHGPNSFPIALVTPSS